MRKRLLSTLLALCMVLTLLPGTAFAADSDFVIENGVLTKYKGPGGDVAIPEDVTSIGSSAFYDCTTLTSVTIPDGVTKIGSQAFTGCTNLTSVTIPGSVESIGSLAFDSCSRLASLFIPEGVTSIGSNAFHDCISLTSAGPIGGDYDYQFGWKTEIPDNAFYGCSGLTIVTIPESVTSIGREAFRSCSSLTSVTIPEGVTTIGGYAFNNCTGLTSVTIPEGVKSLEEWVFGFCSGLTSVTLPESVESIKQNAFYGCAKLTDVYYGGNREQWKLIDIGTNNEYLTDANIHYNPVMASGTCGDNVAWVLDEDGTLTISGTGEMSSYSSASAPWYSNRSQIKSVVIGNGVTNIGNNAFDGCTGLTSVVIPEGVTEIGEGAFSFCSSLTGVVFPDSLTAIKYQAFWCCTSLTSVTILESVTEIGQWAFHGCTGLTSVTIPESVTSIGSSVFEGCIGLTSAGPIGGDYDYQFGWKTEIPDCAFHGCTGLTSVTIPESVTSIGDSAFDGCTSLISLTIPENVTYIGSSAFGGSGLTSLTIPESVTYIGNSAFSTCRGLTSVIIPKSVTSIRYSVFGYCTGLTSTTIPESVTEIGNYAFSGCTNLTDVYYGGSEGDWATVTIGSGNTPLLNATIHFTKADPAYTVSFDANGGSVSPASAAIGTDGKLSSLPIPTRDGYTFDGWFTSASGGDEVTADTVFTEDTTVYAHWTDNSTIVASGTCGANLTWVLNAGGTLTISGMGDMTDYSASRSAPWNSYSIRTVVIESGVTSIGSLAFQYCTGLTGVTIPEGVTSIGFSAFSGCTSLTSVTIPNSVTAIGRLAFSNTPWLKQLGDFAVVNGILLRYQGSGQNVTIPTGVTSIGEGAFYDCDRMTSVTIPTGVTSIGNYAFYGCIDLTGVTIPDGVTSIGDYAFDGCSMLLKVTIPGSVTSIGQWAFAVCMNLTSVTIPGSVKSIGMDAFYGCARLAGVTIQEGVTSIGGSAFAACTSLISVTIPGSVESIGQDAFSGCTGLTGVTIPEGVKSIGEFAFYGCTGLTGVTIPESVTSIGQGAFHGCKSLTSVIIPKGVTFIEYWTFSGCTSLASVTIPNSVADIGNRAFEDCTGLADVYYGGSESQWNAIHIEEWGNEPLLNATIHYSGTGTNTPEPGPDTTALEAAIADAEVLKSSDYTTNSWAALTAAVEAGKALLDKADAAQEEIDMAAAAIRTAISNLVKASNNPGGNTGENPSGNTGENPGGNTDDNTDENTSVTTGSSGEDSETTETTVKPNVTTSGDGKSASSDIDNSVGAEIVKQAETNDSDRVVIKPDMSDDVTIAEVTLPGETLAELGKKTDADVTIETSVGNVTIPNEALKELGSDGGKVSVTVSKDTEDNTISVDIKVDGESTDMVIKAALPSLQDGQVVVLVHEDGTEEIIQKSLVEDGTAYVLLDGSAKVKIVDNNKEFDDVSDGEWYSDAVTFASSHELFKGIGDSTFAPEMGMTRAMLVTVLHRLESEADAGEGVINFTDAVDGAWYVEGMAWASAAGIVQGTSSTTFSPNDNITREQIATMLYRYAGTVGLDTDKRTSLSDYTDGSETSSWAKDAMEWAVAVGLFTGNGDGTLYPSGNATRAQVAIILQRLVGLMVK